MTKDDGNFLLKALEVVGTAEKDGTHSLIVSSNQRFNLNPRAYVIYIYPSTSRYAAARLMKERQEKTSVKT